MTPQRIALKRIQQATDRLHGAVERALVEERTPDPIPNTRHNMEQEIPAMLYWNWSKGYSGDPDTPADPPGLEDVTVMLGEHDITGMLSPEALADVREAMLRAMEADI